MGIFVGIGIQTGGLEDLKCNMPVAAFINSQLSTLNSQFPIVYMYTLGARFLFVPKSVELQPLFSIFSKMEMGKKREDFSGRPCYNDIVKVEGGAHDAP